MSMKEILAAALAASSAVAAAEEVKTCCAEVRKSGEAARDLGEVEMKRLKSALLPPVLSAHPLANEEVLEPSVLNEVNHALSLVPPKAVPPTAAGVDFAKLYATNGLSATQRAIALVSSQKGGSWFWRGTNVTPVAVHLLRQAAGYPELAGAERKRD